jgi:hypothetical protein
VPEASPAELIWIAPAEINVSDEEQDRHWRFAMHLQLPDGVRWPVAIGDAALHEADRVPVRGPTFVIDKRVRVHGRPARVVIGDSGANVRVSLSVLVIGAAIELYRNRYGKDPADLPGRLAFDNKRYFCREYLSLIDAGVAQEVSYISAIRRVSFGMCRVAHGYTEFSVDCSGEDIIYWEGPPEQLRRVPAAISANAWRARHA